MNKLVSKNDFIIPLMIIGLTAILYSFFILLVDKIHKKNLSKKEPDISRQVGRDNVTYKKRILAFLIYGVVPILIIKFIFHERLQDYGFGIYNKNFKLIYFFIMAILIFPIMLLLSKKERINSHYPEVKGAFFSKWSLLISSITYIMYYFGYESLYRGFLVFGLRRYTGDFLAVMASMVFTSITHLSSPGIVLIGSIVSGVIFPYIVILSGSIWALFIFHSIIGIFMDLFCIKAKRDKKSLKFRINISDDKVTGE